MADYPDTIYDPRTKANRSGVDYEPEKESVIFVEDIELLEDEVIAIETDLETRGYSITFIIDGAGSAITTGEKGHLEIPFKCEIQRATLLADVSGDIVIDIWKDTYANFPPTDADTICAGTEPELDGAQKSQDATLTDWIKTINVGDILAFNVDSCATITRVTLALCVKKIA
jgi:hypothetical protein